MRTITHPLSGATYDLDDDGNIEVTKDGAAGTFNRHGQWLSGALRHADPHLCLWIAGETLGASTGAGSTGAGSTGAPSPADRRSVARRIGPMTGSTPSDPSDVSDPDPAPSTSQEAAR